MCHYGPSVFPSIMQTYYVEYMLLLIDHSLNKPSNDIYIGPVLKRIAPINPEQVMSPSVPPRSRIVFSLIPMPLVRMEDPE